MTIRKWSETDELVTIDANQQSMWLDETQPNPEDRIKRAPKSVWDDAVLAAVQKTNNLVGWSITGGGVPAVLTVEAGCTIDQNLSSLSSSVEFAGLSLNADWSGSGLNAPFYIKGATSPNKQLYMGFDTASNVGIVQSIEQGVSVREYKINPAGGAVSVGYVAAIPAVKFSVNGTTYFNGNSETNGTLTAKDLFTLGSSVNAETFTITKDVGFTVFFEDTQELFFDTNVTLVSLAHQYPWTGIIPTPAEGYTLYSNNSASGRPFVKLTDGNAYDLVYGAWSQVTNVLSPLDSLGVKAIQIKSLAQTENVRFTHEGTYVGYDASATSQYHRFWQGIQAETFLRFNNDGDLTTSKGISLYTGNEQYRIGFDDIGATVGYIRHNVDSADAVHGHLFSAGTIGSATSLSLIRGDGRLSVGHTSPESRIDSVGDIRVGEITTPAPPTSGVKTYAKNDGYYYVLNAAGVETNVTLGASDSKWDVSGAKLTPKAALSITGTIIKDATGFETMETTHLGHTFDFNMSDITGIFRFFQAVQTSTQFRVLNNAALSDVSGISFHGNNELYRMGYDAQGSNVFLRANLGAADADHAFAISFGSDVVNAPVFFKFDGTATATIFDTTEAESFTINKSLTTTTFTDSNNLLTFASDVSFSTKIISDVIIENATPSLTIRDSVDNNKRMFFEYDVANECGIISAFGTASANRVLKLTPGFTTAVGLPAANAVSTIASEQPTFVNYANQYLYNLLQTNQSAAAATPATITDFYNTQRYNQIAGTRSDTMWQVGILQETSASDNDRWFVGRPGLSSADLVVHRTGRVAIGTASSQAEQLHVAGTFRATGASTLLSVNVTGATTLNTLDVTGLTTVSTFIATTAGQFSNYADFSAIATPATPGSNFRVYQGTDKNLYGLNSDGNRFNLSASNVRIVTTSDTNTTADDVILCDSTAGAIIFTVDTSLLKKRIVVIHDKGGNGVSWGPAGGQTISTVAAPILFAGQYSAVTIEPGSVSTEARIVAQYL